jgi:hypothetical protein
MDVEPAVAQIARRQHGLITRAQAIGAGLTPSAIQVRLGKGLWLTARRSVYAVAAVPPSSEQAALAVCLSHGAGRCWLSHRSAGSLWGLSVPAPSGIDVVTPSAVRVNQPGVRQHRSKELYLADLTWCGPIPTTTVARTLVDCIPFLRGRRGLLDLHELSACASRLDHRGRRLLRTLRPVLADRIEGRLPGGSRRELAVLDVLGAAGVPLPVQQFRVSVGGRVRVLDFAYPDEMIGLEWDGYAEHGPIRSTFDDDRLRGNDLAVAGWLMLHFTSNSAPRHVVARTAEALRLRGRHLA